MSLRFSHEPVVYVGLALAVLAVVKSILLHEPITEAVLEPVFIAGSAVVVRSKVSPVAKG